MIIFYVLWYAIGLIASHVIISISEILTWENSWPVGIFMGILGPINFFGLLSVL